MFFGSWHKFQVLLGPALCAYQEHVQFVLISSPHPPWNGPGIYPKLGWNKSPISLQQWAPQHETKFKWREWSEIHNTPWLLPSFVYLYKPAAIWLNFTVFTHHTLELLKQQRMRLTLQQKVGMECKSIHSQRSRLHCLSWTWISSTGTKHVLHWLTAHPKRLHLMHLFILMHNWLRFLA